jgi:TRAP-type C4-dicarboxylate transport system permease small subunit
MGALNNVLFKLEKAVDSCIVVVCGSMLFGITALVFIQVIFRYVLQDSISWSEELTRYMLVWVVFLASGYVLNKGGHANIDLLLNLFPQTMRTIVERSSLLLIVCFSCLIIRYGFILMRFGQRQVSSALGIPMNYVYLAIPIGGGLLVFYCLVMFFRKKGDAL